MRRLDPLTPDEARELDALDRALAGMPVDPDLRELEQLVADMRASAPEMSPAFAARLERDVADGFPEPVERPLLRRPRRWVMLPAAGVLAAALIAIVVVLGNNDSSKPVSGALSDVPAASAPATTDPSFSAGGAGSDASGAVAESKAAPAPADRAAKQAAPQPSAAPAPASATGAPALALAA